MERKPPDPPGYRGPGGHGREQVITAGWRRASAAALFALTIIILAVMWQPAFWATALAEVSIYCLAVLWLVFFTLKPQTMRRGFVLIPLVAAVLWPLLQLGIGVTVYRWATSVSVLYWAANAAVVFIGMQIFGDAGLRRGYLRALMIAGFALAIIAPLQLFTSDGKIFWLFEVKFSNVAMGPFVYPNQYAAFIELLLPIALTGVFSDRAGWRTFHGLAAVVMYASVFASASRSGFILVSLEVLIVPFLAAKRAGVSGRQMIVSGTVFLGMLIVLGLAIGPETLIVKLQQKDPYRGRREYVESSLRMVRDKPLFGVGMGNWPTAYPAYAIFDDGSFANQAHNDWAQWAVEGGIPFAMLILSVAIWSAPRAFQTGWGIGVCIVFLQCLVDYPIQKTGVAIVFFTLIGALCYPEERADRTDFRETSRKRRTDQAARGV